MASTSEDTRGLGNTFGLILAAGYGTRLGALSDERPKPLLPVGDVPLVRWAAALLAKAGIRNLGVNVHHLGHDLRRELGEEFGDPTEPRRRLPVHYSVEEEIQGTGGGIRDLARAAPGKTLVVANGKIVANIDLAAALAEHRRRGALATLVCAPHRNARAWGAIGVDGDGRIARLLDRASTAESAGRALRDPTLAEHMFTGVHIIESELLEVLPETGPCCIVRDAYLPLFLKGAPLFAHVHRGYFYEHSTPERYLQGNLNLFRKDLSLPAAPGPLVGVHEDAIVAEGVDIAESVLICRGAHIEAGARVGPAVVVGAGVTIAAGAQVSESVLWPGAKVDASLKLRRAIVTPRQTVTVPETADPWARPR